MSHREAFERLTELATAVFDAPTAFVTVLESDHQGFRACRGAVLDRVDLRDSFCAQAVQGGEGSVMVVEDARRDARFAANPFVAEGLRFYAGATITTADGRPNGAVCVTDTRVRKASQAQIDALRQLARLAAIEIDLIRQDRLQTEREQTLELAERMAGVGHWRLDRATGEVWWSDEVYRIHGLRRGEVDPSRWSAEGDYHPEDAAVVRRLFARALETGEGYDAELRLTRPDGQQRFTRTRARCLTDETGRVESLFGVFQDVTDTVRARETLERSEALYRLMSEGATDIIARYRPDGTFLYLSPSVEQVLGRSPQSLIGKTCAEVIHPDDVAATYDRMQTGMREARAGEPVHIEYRAIRADGSIAWLEASPRSVTDPAGRVVEIHDHVRDISRRKAAEAEQAKLVETLNLAGQMAGVGHWRLEVANSRVTWSDEVYRIHGVDPVTFDPNYDEALDFYHPEDRDLVRAGIQASIEGGEPGEFKLRLIRADGEERVVASRWTPERDTEGRAVAICGVFQDVTPAEMAARRLEEARDRAEAASQAKSEFLANMSHELRTPLTSVIGFSGLLGASRALPEKEKRFVDRIQAASQALLSVINDILDYSKLEADAVDLDPRPYEPRVLAESAAGIVEAQCRARGLALTVEVDPDTPPTLVGDEGRLRQVMLNFLSNAAKFTAQGGVTLRVRPVGDRIRVEVTDTGIGIAPDKIDILFERFTQADASTTRTHGGTGLGLAISRRLIGLMGGEIGASSRPGEGSTFWFEAPMTRAVAEEVDAASPSLAEGAPRGLRVLVADDADANRELIGVLLSGLETELTAVCDGAEAVEAARRGAYDLILMDVHMPVMDGLAATESIRALPGDAGRTPIIALTANVQPYQIERCKAAGMNGHVGKPIRAETLFGVMNDCLATASDNGARASAKTASL